MPICTHPHSQPLLTMLYLICILFSLIFVYDVLYANRYSFLLSCFPFFDPATFCPSLTSHGDWFLLWLLHVAMSPHHRISLCSYACPRTQSIDQDGLELTALPASAMGGCV